jgi:hypothetical protein
MVHLGYAAPAGDASASASHGVGFVAAAVADEEHLQRSRSLVLLILHDADPQQLN